MTIGLVEIFSYFTPALRTYGWGGLTMMALPTAVLFIALGAAVVGSVRPSNPAASTGSAQPFSGLDALKLLQASGHDLPFIMVSGAMGEETAVSAMRAGAHDYLLKHDLSRLGPAVERELTHAADRRARRLAEEAAQQTEGLLVAAGQMANFGGWSFNLADSKLCWSDQVALIHEEPPGFSPTLAQGLNYYAPEWRDKITAVFTACARDGTPYDEELEIFTTRGRRVWVRAVGMALRDAGGRIHQVQGAFQDITARKHEEAIDAFLAQAGVSAKGDSFFPALARFLAKTLQMDYICIDRLEGDALNATTLAVWHDGRFEDNLTYALKDTPCGEVVGKTVCCYPAHVVQSFPNDPALQELRAESYVGVTLFSHTGQPIGLIALIGRQPLTNRALAETTVARVAPRAAGELERLMVEAALSKSEARLNFALQQIMTGAWDLDLRDHTAHRTLIHDQIFGYKMLLPEWTYEMFLEHVLPEDRANVDRLFAQATAAQTDWNFECRIRRTDGEVRWITAAGSHERSSENKSIRMAGIVQDITERKQAEIALRESEERFRRAIVDSPIPIMIHADDETIIQTSNSWHTITGYSPGELTTIGDWTERAYGKRKAAVEAYIDTLYAMTGPKYEGDYEVRTKSGATRIWEFSSAPLGRLPDGRRLVMSMAMDVTERRQAEEALRAREEIFSSIVGQANDAIALIDAETGRFREFNRAAHEDLGYTREEFAGLRVSDIQAEQDESQIRANIRQILTVGGLTLETRHRHRDGSMRDVRISARAMKLRGRDCLTAVWGDITEAKRLEQELQLSEARFRVLFEDISTVAIRGYRADGTTQFWNRASERFYGYTAQEAVGRNLRDLIIPPEMQSGVAEAMRQMADHGTPIPSGELSLQRKDGSRIEVYSNHAIVQPPHRPAELFCMDVDLTSLKRAEQILRQQAEELRLRNESLSRFNAVAVGRELRMIELKREINELCDRVGEPPRHHLPVLEESPR